MKYRNESSEQFLCCIISLSIRSYDYLTRNAFRFCADIHSTNRFSQSFDSIFSEHFYRPLLSLVLKPMYFALKISK